MSRPTDHLDDQRLSDLMDGVGPDRDLAHLSECEHCRNRLNAWRDVAKAVSAVAPVSAERREAAIGAALSMLGHDDEAAEDSAIVEMATRRKRRRLGFTARVGAAAAAVTLVGGVSAALLTGGGGRANHQASTAAPTASPSAAQSGVASGSGASGGSASASGVLALGNVDSTSQLVTTLKASGYGASSQGTLGVEPSSASSTPCPPRSTASGSLTEQATLVWKGIPAKAFVYTTSNKNTVVVVSDSGCRVLATATY